MRTLVDCTGGNFLGVGGIEITRPPPISVHSELDDIKPLWQFGVTKEYPPGFIPKLFCHTVGPAQGQGSRYI